MNRRDAVDDLTDAISAVDRALGAGAAKLYPGVVAATLSALSAERDRQNWKQIALKMAEAMRSDHPLQGETFSGIEESLGAIATAIEELVGGGA